MGSLFEVVFEDADLLVVNKPADLVCHPTKGDVYSSLISRVRLYLGPEAQPQLINRLDRETSGLVVVGKHPAAAASVRNVWERRQVEKIYLAIVHGVPTASEGIIDAPLGKDTTSEVAIKDAVVADGAPAQTEFRVLRTFRRAEGEFSLLEVKPRTGRKHQIRIHLAHLGYPLVGDKIYGGDETLYLDFVRGQLSPERWRRLILPHHALHAAEVQFEWGGKDCRFKAEPESWLVRFYTEDVL